jgi:hypothetical protein
VLLANQTPGDYWIRIQSYGDCVGGGNDGHGAAVLHYNGYEGKDDYMPNTDVEDFSQKGIVSIRCCCFLKNIKFYSYRIDIILQHNAVFIRDLSYRNRNILDLKVYRSYFKH